LALVPAENGTGCMLRYDALFNGCAPKIACRSAQIAGGGARIR
jgi:hypothetical protein